MPTRVIVTSKNPVKLAATQRSFAKMLPDQTCEFVPVAVASGVSDQPMSDDETYQGAANRIANAMRDYPDGDFYVAMEGGIEQRLDETNTRVLDVFGRVIIASRDSSDSSDSSDNQHNHPCRGQSRSVTCTLPPRVAALVHEGHELGVANDIVFGQTNSKHAGGAIGILTHDVLDRTIAFEHPAICALVTFANADLYAPTQST